MTCMNFKAKRKLLTITSEAQLIPLSYNQHYQQPSKAIAMAREQLERGIRGCQPELVTLNASSRTECQQRGLQCVPTKFGEFLREPRDTQHNNHLCHAQVLTLMQSITQKHAASV